MNTTESAAPGWIHAGGDDALTDLGRSLLAAIEGLVSWTRAHRLEIADARSGYDARRESSA